MNQPLKTSTTIRGKAFKLIAESWIRLTFDSFSLNGFTFPVIKMSINDAYRHIEAIDTDRVIEATIIDRDMFYIISKSLPTDTAYLFTLDVYFQDKEKGHFYHSIFRYFNVYAEAVIFMKRYYNKNSDDLTATPFFKDV